MNQNNNNPTNGINTKWILVLVYSFILGLFIFSYLLSRFFDAPYSDFTRDPLAVMKTHPFVGFLSNIGVIIWIVTATISLFTSYLIEKEKLQNRYLFHFFSGAITSILLVDDLFMIHDRIFPIYLKISEVPLFIFYGILITVYLYYYRKQILKYDYIILLIALFMFAFSLGVDHFDVESEFIHFFEDGPKLLGIAAWFVFYLSASISDLSTNSFKSTTN
ncbi:hypothetical protein ACUNWD_14145 [Sunxiuqinia sp. A32]|uniref:hypothetical protein n=1 Tax=Sunxiuqinia sp. A32 TaxID=3461496 RepID=UPI0040457C97